MMSRRSRTAQPVRKNDGARIVAVRSLANVTLRATNCSMTEYGKMFSSVLLEFYPSGNATQLISDLLAEMRKRPGWHDFLRDANTSVVRRKLAINVAHEQRSIPSPHHGAAKVVTA